MAEKLHNMAEQKDDPQPKKLKESKELRDLQPEKDAQGGAHTDPESGSRSPKRTAEIDFMSWE
ncbi:MAG: hypothetical protein ACR2G0_12905 [Chthoniobacterales bacterium]